MPLGEIVCTTEMCKSGRAAVAKMWHTLNYLQTTATGFNAENFRPAAAAIQASVDAVDSWYADLIPFNPTCCTIDDAGKQADLLTNQMLNSVGVSPVAIPPAPPATDWGTIIVFGGAVLLLIAYAPQIKQALKR